MKKLRLLIFCVLTVSLHAQNGKFCPASFAEFNATQQSVYSQKNTASFQTDTLKPASFSLACYTTNPSSALVLYYADVKVPHDSGYVSGTNIYGDLEKAQHYLVSSSTTITGCAVLLKRANSSTSFTIGTKVKLYNYSGGVPSTSVIASTNLIPQYQLNNNGLTVFTFTAPIVITGNFVMSVVLPNNAGDTTAIYSTKTSCNSSASESWEKAINNVWGSIHNNWNFSTVQNIDLAIFPLIKGSFITGFPTQYYSIPILFDSENSILKTQLLTSPLTVSVIDLSGNIRINHKMGSNDDLEINTLPNGVYVLQAVDLKNNFFIKKIVVFH